MIDCITKYIEQFPPNLQEKLFAIKSAIETTAPFLERRIAWNMPAYFLDKTDIIEFSVQKCFISLHIGASAYLHFEEELKQYSTSSKKNVIRFDFSDDIPVNLISSIVSYILFGSYRPL